ncbi:MAG: hypothetical protein MUE58_10930 [Chitinophagaceae bacterium]|jgi:hypothetical protein|nr:hypothetical protein [Chitinophagaceae bacterium]
MKKNILKFAAGLMIVAATATTAFAGDNGPITPVKLIGYKDNQPVYRLTLDNPENDKVTVVIKDEFGVILHEEVMYGKTISRNYLINTLTIDASNIQFEVSRSTSPAVTKVNIKADKQ